MAELLKQRIKELEQIVGETYQVVGVLATECNRFDDPALAKVLDNLSSSTLQHLDVLPFLLKEAAHAADQVEPDCPFEWHDGEPPFPYGEEWFIAETTSGDRIVLVSLPEEYSYDYRTADQTYIKRNKIKRWGQFPDSEYKPYVPPATAAQPALSAQDFAHLLSNHSEDDRRAIIAEIQSTLPAQPAHDPSTHAVVPPYEIIAEHSGCGYAPQVDQLFVRIERDELIVKIKAPKRERIPAQPQPADTGVREADAKRAEWFNRVQVITGRWSRRVTTKYSESFAVSAMDLLSEALKLWPFAWPVNDISQLRQEASDNRRYARQSGAAPQVQQQEAWQPIDTAPKDGTWILGARKYRTRPLQVQFDASFGQFIDDDGVYIYDLTHWMAIPNLPVEREKK